MGMVRVVSTLSASVSLRHRTSTFAHVSEANSSRRAPVGSSVKQHRQLAGLRAGSLDGPVLHVADGAPDGLAIELSLKHERLCAVRRHTDSQSRGLGVAQKGLGLACWATQALDVPRREVVALAQVDISGLARA